MCRQCIGTFCVKTAASGESSMEYSYMEFVEEFRQLLLAATGKEENWIYFKEGKEIPKTKGDRLFIVVSDYEDKREVCGLYIMDLYEEYQEGVPMAVLLRQVLDEIQNLKNSGIIGKVLELEHYERIKDSLCIRLLNMKKNQWDLEDAFYRTLGDIALVVYLKIGDQKGVLTTMKVRKTMLQDWEVEEREVFETALLNTYYMSPPRIYSWRDWIGDPDYEGEAFMNLMQKQHLNKGHWGNCLSTKTKTNGAVAIFLPGVAERVAELLDGSFYMVFTSVHEVMIHKDTEVEEDALREILRDTIHVATMEDEFLTYKIYHYNREKKEFTYH